MVCLLAFQIAEIAQEFVGIVVIGLALVIETLKYKTELKYFQK